MIDLRSGRAVDQPLRGKQSAQVAIEWVEPGIRRDLIVDEDGAGDVAAPGTRIGLREPGERRVACLRTGGKRCEQLHRFSAAPGLDPGDSGCELAPLGFAGAVPGVGNHHVSDRAAERRHTHAEQPVAPPPPQLEIAFVPKVLIDLSEDIRHACASVSAAARPSRKAREPGSGRLAPLDRAAHGRQLLLGPAPGFGDLDHGVEKLPSSIGDRLHPGCIEPAPILQPRSRSKPKKSGVHAAS